MLSRIAFLLVCCLVLGACAPYTLSPKSYPRHTTMTAMKVNRGEVLEVAEVSIEGQAGPVGTWGGAAVGHAAGRSIGGGTGARLAGAAGGLAGALIGQAVEKALTAETGLEITVKLDNGEVLAIVQADDESFAEGDRVKVLRGRGTARVRHL